MPEQKDFYTPENVDAEIEALLQASGSPARDQRLMRDLSFMHRPLDSEDERSLERVLSHLLDKDPGQPSQPDSVPLLLERDQHKEEGRFLFMQNTGLTAQNKRTQRTAWQRLGVLAAIFVVVVVVGSMLTVLNVARQGQGTSTGNTTLPQATRTSITKQRPGQIVYQSGNYNEVSNLSWSPDGKRIVSTQDTGTNMPVTIQSWDALNHQHVLTYKIPEASLYGAGVWSADGKRLAVVAQKVYVFDAQTSRLLMTLAAPSGEARSGGFPSSTTSSTTGTLSGGTSLLSSAITLAKGSPVFTSVGWSPDNRWLAAAYGSYNQNEVYIWNAKTGQLVKTLTSSQDDIYQISWSPDGKFLAASFYNPNSPGSISALRIWDSTTWKMVKQYNNLQAFSWSPDGGQLALVDAAPAQGKDVRIVNVLSGQTMKQFSETGHIETVSWSPDGSRIAVEYNGLAGKGNVIIWDAMSGRQILRFTPAQVTDLVWSPDSRYIACVTTGVSPRVLVWVAQ